MSESQKNNTNTQQENQVKSIASLQYHRNKSKEWRVKNRESARIRSRKQYLTKHPKARKNLPKNYWRKEAQKPINKYFVQTRDHAERLTTEITELGFFSKTKKTVTGEYVIYKLRLAHE